MVYKNNIYLIEVINILVVFIILGQFLLILNIDRHIIHYRYISKKNYFTIYTFHVFQTYYYY